jgi:hypothetical protein
MPVPYFFSNYLRKKNMKFQSIEIGGKLRPIRFSFAALYEYEKNTGRNALQDFAQLQGENISVTIAADLIYAGLSLGCKTNGVMPDFTPYDIADWSFQSPDVIAKAMNIFTESFSKKEVETGKESGKKNLRAGIA